MATLFPCTDLDTGDRVAVKVIDTNREIDRLEETIFERELNVQHLRHPHIAALRESGRLESGEYYLVYDWIDNDLKRWVEEQRPLGADDFVERIALPLISGLAYAHEHDVVHRDVKPANVLVTDSGVPKLADFGISKVKNQLVESGPTVVDFVSRPFAPPEGHHTSSYSRDVFSFGVLMLWCLSEIPVDDYPDFQDALEDIDASPELIDLIDMCTSLDEDERPRTAVEVHAKLEDIQGARRQRWIQTSALHLALTNKARRSLEGSLGLIGSRLEAWLLKDYSESAAIRPLANKEVRSPDDVEAFMYGTTSRLHIVLNPDNPVAVVKGAAVIDEAECDSRRDRSYVAETFQVVMGNPIGTTEAIESIRRLLGAIEEHEAKSADELAAQQERRLFDQWRLQLDAREAFDARSSGSIRFANASVEGFRITVEISAPLEEDIVEQRRRVVDDKNRLLSPGVIESVNGLSVTLYLDREPRRPIRSGVLLPDNNASSVKLRRERNALEAVRHGSSALVRPSLPDLVLHPEDVAPLAMPDLADVEWVQDLDAPKQEAVAATLGSDDFVVVEGPPGTGKTAFIAEVVAQTLRRDPQARILIASQTNVALDNALQRVQGLGDEISLLRIGNATYSKIASEVHHLTADVQLRRMRERIEKRSMRYLEALAEDNGAPLDQIQTSIALRRLAVLEDEMAALDARKESDKRQIEQNHFDEETNPLTDDDIESLQDDLRQVSDRRKVLWSEVKEIRDEKLVARHAGQRGTKTPEEIRMIADSLLSADDRDQIKPLMDLQAEWLERLGRGDEFHEALLRSTQVVAATCIGLSAFKGADGAVFDLCIVDEASKATATETLVPLVRASRWVLVGDDKQLPPFQDEALRSQDLIGEFSLDEHELHQSLFSRMAAGLPDSHRMQLVIQYRMVDPIGTLISECFYEGQIRNAGVVSPRWTAGLQSSPVTWFDTHGLPNHEEYQKRGETSFSNRKEVERIVQYLKRVDFLLANQRFDDELTLTALVLAPYAAQVQALHRSLSKLQLSFPGLKIEVNTVDAAQGREADLLIFSATRSNASGDIGHVRDFARSNVALSRGRFQLAIFGDAPFYDGLQGPLTDVLSHIRTHPGSCTLEELDS